MTPVIHRSASTQMGEETRQESPAITGQPSPNEFPRTRGPNEDDRHNITEITFKDHVGPRPRRDIDVVAPVHSARAFYILGPFLDVNRVALRPTSGTVAGLEVGNILARVPGYHMAVQAHQTESTEGHATRPPARDATSVATVAAATAGFVSRYLLKIARDAADEVFVDGMESEFASQLEVLIKAYGRIAVHAIEGYVRLDEANIEAVGEILRVIGAIEDPLTHGSRLEILLTSLTSPDPRIRDAASLGIAALDDTSVVDYVIAAVEREQILDLQRNLQLVVDQLQSTEWRIS